MSKPIITLLTDFGESDGFVGTMKGVILSINPEANLVDVSHAIAPQNVKAAAFVLHTSYRYFPEGTIHVVVVDPGVGSSRRILLVESDRHVFLAPDNGVLMYVFRDSRRLRVVNVTNSEYFLSPVSQTFHGRDIFAPVAAHLASGVPPEAFGQEVTDFDRGRLPTLEERADGLVGEIIHVDRFGNLITNLPLEKVGRSKRFCLKLGDRTVSKLVASYSAAAPGEPVAVPGSSGYLEIACNLGHASQQLGCSVGEKVILTIDEAAQS